MSTLSSTSRVFRERVWLARDPHGSLYATFDAKEAHQASGRPGWSVKQYVLAPAPSQEPADPEPEAIP